MASQNCVSSVTLSEQQVAEAGQLELSIRTLVNAGIHWKPPMVAQRRDSSSSRTT